MGRAGGCCGVPAARGCVGLVLGAAMGTLTLSNARALDGRRRHAEQLLRGLLRAEDGERHRIVGSLHDDFGQTLYRVLYGLEGCRARPGEEFLVAAELDKLTAGRERSTASCGPNCAACIAPAWTASSSRQRSKTPS
jgi:hypothetical protein